MTMLAAFSLIASLFELEDDPLALLGIEETVLEERAPKLTWERCTEGSSHMVTRTQTRKTAVEQPAVRATSVQTCRGHVVDDVPYPEKQGNHFKHQKTADELRVKLKQHYTSHPDVYRADSDAWATYDTNHKTWFVRTTYYHVDDCPACTQCSVATPSPDAPLAKRVHRCQGHVNPAYGKCDSWHAAENKLQKIQGACTGLIHDFRIHEFADGSGYDIVGWYRHPDAETPHNCGAEVAYDVYEQAEKIRTWWEGDKMGDLESNPHCRVVRSTISDDGDSRTIVFACDDSTSSCAVFRLEGAVLHSQKDLGDGVWEKTYQFGDDFTPHTEATYRFKPGAKLQGLCNEFDDLKHHEKHEGFEQATMSLGTAMNRCRSESEAETGIFFAGDPVLCLCDGISGVDGCAARAEIREGRCHFVGAQALAQGTERVYCCFATPLARIAQEQAKKDWGTFSNPNCGPLSEKEANLPVAGMEILRRETEEKIRQKLSSPGES